jgi:hypothetical protein
VDEPQKRHVSRKSSSKRLAFGQTLQTVSAITLPGNVPAEIANKIGPVDRVIDITLCRTQLQLPLTPRNLSVHIIWKQLGTRRYSALTTHK